MADKQINIPVKVTGADQARQELHGLADAARGAQAAAAQAGGAQPIGEQAIQAATRQAAAVGKVADESARAGVETVNFNRKAQGLVTTMLGAVNPALGQAAGFALNFVEGVARMTRQFLAFAGVAAAIGAVVAVLRSVRDAANEAAEAADRLRRANEDARLAGLGERGRLLEQTMRLGMPGQTNVVQQIAGELQRERGVPAALATQVALAERYAATRGTPFDREQFLAGLVASGGQVDLSQAPRGAAGAIRQIQARGASSDAGLALREYLAQAAPAARLAAAVRESERIEPRDVAERLFFRERADLSDAERERVRKMAADEAIWGPPRDGPQLGNDTPFARARDRGLVSEWRMRRGMELLEAARALRRETAEVGAGVPTPTTMTVINVNTGFFDRGAPPMAPGPESLLDERLGY